MAETNTIVVIGSYAVGMTIVGDHFPIAGETVPGSNFLMSHGGKAPIRLWQQPAWEVMSSMGRA